MAGPGAPSLVKNKGRWPPLQASVARWEVGYDSIVHASVLREVQNCLSRNEKRHEDEVSGGDQKKYSRRAWIRIALVLAFLGGLALAVYMTESPPIITHLPEAAEGLVPISQADAEVIALPYLESNAESPALEAAVFIHSEIR